MREPHIRFDKDVEYVPFSQASAHLLRTVISGTCKKALTADEFYDAEFRRWYASYILSQRP